MENIRAYFEKFVDLNDYLWSLFTEKIEYIEIAKGETILKKGEVENYVYILQSGAVRLFIPQKDNEITFGFAFEGHFFSAYDSFIYRSPCVYQIETLTEVKVWRMSHKDLNNLFENISEGNSIGRKMAELFFIGKQKRELSLLTKTAEERYYSLFRFQPKLIKEIPLKYIASYIGITPQGLSRIRSRIS
jgi:CRP-like cAMP-binding protein